MGGGQLLGRGERTVQGNRLLFQDFSVEETAPRRIWVQESIWEMPSKALLRPTVLP